MSAPGKKALFSDSELEALRDSVALFAETLKTKGIKIPDNVRNEVFGESIKHHVQHLGQLSIRQVAVDPYKIITWFCFCLAKRLNGYGTIRDLAYCAVRTLNFCLSSERPLGGLAEGTVSYLEDFVVNELEGRPEFGIGQNGLFVGFHTASMMKRKAARSFNQGWGNVEPEKGSV